MSEPGDGENGMVLSSPSGWSTRVMERLTPYQRQLVRLQNTRLDPDITWQKLSERSSPGYYLRTLAAHFSSKQNERDEVSKSSSRMAYLGTIPNNSNPALAFNYKTREWWPREKVMKRMRYFNPKKQKDEIVEVDMTMGTQRLVASWDTSGGGAKPVYDTFRYVVGKGWMVERCLMEPENEFGPVCP